MVRRLFTPVQANATLPLVRRIVADILARGRELHTLARPGNKRTGTHARIAELREEVQKLIAELDQIGCSYKDWGFESGLVDFPGKIAGQRVLLCWRSDEESVAHYHSYDEGYAGRRPIPEHLFHDERSEEAARDATA